MKEQEDSWPCPVYRLQGPPGTGKTHTLTKAWIPRAVSLYGEDSVHVCSLTRAAAAEIGGRANLPRKSVSTLHSLAFRAQGSPGLAQDARNVESWNGSVPTEWRVTGKVRGSSDDLDFSSGKAECGDELLNEATILRNKLIPTKEWIGPVLPFYQAWRSWKRDNQFLDFTDLIEMPVEFNAPPPGCLKALICDEAQDFTFLDIRLIKHWAKWMDMVVLAGDANQALYSFIGANPRAFMPADIPDSEITTLGQSYRVPRAVVDYADAWIQQDTEHRLFPYAARLDDGVEVKGIVARKPGLMLDRPRPLVEDMMVQVAKGNEAMVLATCKYQLVRVLAYLRRSGIPFHNPYRLAEPAWNPLRGGVRRLAAFLRPFRQELDGGEDGWSWADLALWVNPIRLKGTFRQGAGTEIEFKKKRPGRVSQDDIRGLLLPDQLQPMMDALEADDPSEAVEWYSSRLNKSGTVLMAMAISIAQNSSIEALEERPHVIVGTYHSTKGGEADVVYLAPDLGSAAMKEWDLISEPEGRNSIVRSIYVGLTRAKKAVALLGASSRNRIEWI